MEGASPEDWLKWGALGANTLTMFLCLGLLRWALGKVFNYISKLSTLLGRLEAKLGEADDNTRED